MAKRKKCVHQVNVHLKGATREPFQLRARLTDPRQDHYEILKGSPILGLIAGDMVACEIGKDGSRHVSGLEALQVGTLGVVTAVGKFCGHHLMPMLEQTAEDWSKEGCREIDVVDNGLIAGFWPSPVPRADAEMAVRRSAEEHGLNSVVVGAIERKLLVTDSLDFAGPESRDDPTAA